MSMLLCTSIWSRRVWTWTRLRKTISLLSSLPCADGAANGRVMEVSSLFHQLTLKLTTRLVSCTVVHKTIVVQDYVCRTMLLYSSIIVQDYITSSCPHWTGAWEGERQETKVIQSYIRPAGGSVAMAEAGNGFVTLSRKIKSREKEIKEKSDEKNNQNFLRLKCLWQPTPHISASWYGWQPQLGNVLQRPQWNHCQG